MSNRRNKWERRRRRWELERSKKRRADPEGTNPRRTMHIAYCSVHGKKLLTRKAAKGLIRDLHDTGIRKFPCEAHPNSDWWHIGHLPEEVRKGRKSIVQIYDRSGS